MTTTDEVRGDGMTWERGRPIGWSAARWPDPFPADDLDARDAEAARRREHAGPTPGAGVGGGSHMKARVLEGFAGPGGFSEAARMLGLESAGGVELNRDSCATAEAAGHRRTLADIRTLNPDDFAGVQGWASGPPCPTYSESGKRSGHGDYEIVLNASTTLGDSTCLMVGDPNEDAYAAAYTAVADQRSALVLETLKFALRLPDLEWLVAEQVPAVERIWWDFAAELACADWRSAAVLALRADDFGLPTRRGRAVLVAARDRDVDLTGLPFRAGLAMGRFDAPYPLASCPVTPFPRHTMAQVLGWPAGVRVNTRGNRQTSGGNEFSADNPAPGLTYTARSWYRTDLGSVEGRLTAAQAGLMQGFPADYPWRGARTSQFQRVADSVPPPLAAAALGVAADVPWQEAVWARLGVLYGASRVVGERIGDGARAAASAQGGLFEVAA